MSLRDEMQFREVQQPSDEAVFASLRERGLLPLGDAPQVEWPGPAEVDRTYVRGAILGSAIGDALGWPVEGWTPADIREEYGRLTDFTMRLGWPSNGPGSWTDDTQLTVCVAGSLIVGGGRLDVEHLARSFQVWLPDGRGMGLTCRDAVMRLITGTPWWESGQPSAGNGAAMRVAPVGLVHVGDLAALRTDAALSAVVTHADRMAVASAITQAFLVAWCARCEPGALDPTRMLDALAAVLADVLDEGAVEQREGAGRDKVRLVDRLVEVGDMLDLAPDEAFGRLWNGAFVLESLPAALWCFLRSPEDAERVLVTAVNGGYDADTVGAMAGALVGAYLGEDAFPDRWCGHNLEEANGLIDLADQLHAASRNRP